MTISLFGIALAVAWMLGAWQFMARQREGDRRGAKRALITALAVTAALIALMAALAPVQPTN